MKLKKMFAEKKLDNKGQAMVEFAITIPVFIFVIAMLIFILQTFANKVILGTAVSNGCRAAVVCSTPTAAKKAAKTAIKDITKNRFGANEPNIEFDCPSENNWKKGKNFRVTVTMQTNNIFPIKTISNKALSKASMTMKIENGKRAG